MGSSGRIPHRREIWWTDFVPTTGREITKDRPAVVLSADELQDSDRGMVIVVPCSSTDRGFPSHVELTPSDSRMKETTYAMCEQIRAVDLQRLKRCVGFVDADNVLRAIEDRVAALLDLPTIP
jgi:mRNA interferase MazF